MSREQENPKKDFLALFGFSSGQILPEASKPLVLPQVSWEQEISPLKRISWLPPNLSAPPGWAGAGKPKKDFLALVGTRQEQDNPKKRILQPPKPGTPPGWVGAEKPQKRISRPSPNPGCSPRLDRSRKTP